MENLHNCNADKLKLSAKYQLEVSAAGDVNYIFWCETGDIFQGSLTDKNPSKIISGDCNIDCFIVYNKGAQVVFSLNGYTEEKTYQICSWSLAYGDTLQYNCHNGFSVIDKDGKLKVTTGSGGGGGGDMYKSVYDTNDNGKVNEAEAVAWAGITGKPSTFAPSTHNHDSSYYTKS